MRKMFSEKQVEEMAKEVADHEVEELVEGGTLDNAKPIYIHPLLFSKTGTGDKYIVTFAIFIFNNSATRFTFASAIQFIKDTASKINGTARFNATGSFVVENKLYVANHIYCLPDGSACGLMGITDDGVRTDLNLLTLTGVTLYDGVNKLN